ncbi:MAG TPA: hypothetical protein VLL51_05100, partial [Gemmatimonadales bacterium]|nr:hypothetical protein [Gemmatimonadales bacterium]
MTAVCTHPACLRHDPGPGHPESVERLEVVLDRLAGVGRHPILESGPASEAAVRAVHPQHYLALLQQTALRGGGALDADTVLNRHSWEAAIGGAGACLTALETALD